MAVYNIVFLTIGPAIIMFVVRIYYNHSDAYSKKWKMFESGLKKVLSSTLISGCHQNEIALNPKCLPANQDPVIDGFSILFAILMEHNFHLFYFSPQCACLSLPPSSPLVFSVPFNSPYFCLLCPMAKLV